MLPDLYFFPLEIDLLAVNGSSSTGRCSNFITSITRQTCISPTSSVLFDGNVSTLTGLDGDMWASQLLTINTTANTANITFDFTDTPDYTGVERVEVVMFNCPEWGISVRLIQLFSATSISRSRAFVTSITPTTTSCDSLVRVCISGLIVRSVITLVFTLPSTSKWVHLAEVTFYASGSTCPPDTIITPLFTSSSITASSPIPTTTINSIVNVTSTTPKMTATSQTQQIMVQCEVCPSCSASTTTQVSVITAFVTAIVTALLATVVFLVVQIAVCKFHPKFRSGGAGVSAGGEGQVYEEVGGDEESVAVEGVKGVSDPTYMEVGEGGGKTFQLKENEAYGTRR